jgi:hypothetical protein
MDWAASEIHVRAYSAQPHRPAVAIVTGAVNVLDIEGKVKTLPDMPVVVAFLDIFAAVVEAAVAQQEPQPAILQVISGGPS